MELFTRQQVFRGFREGGLEFHADLALPYRNDFQRIPMHGQFVLGQVPPASIASSRRAIASCAEPYEIDVGVRDWISAIRANTAYIVPGSPWENGYCQSLNGRWFDDKH